MLWRVTDRGELVPPGDTAPTGDCTLLLPAARSSITALDVGAGEARLLRKTLPWRLEDTLLAPADSLHIAHGPVQDGRVAVTLTDRVWLQRARDTALAQGLVPQAAHAELSLVPCQPRQWTLWPDAAADRLLVRHGWHQGFACDSGNLAAALTLLHNEQQAWPEQIVYYGPQADADALHARLPQSLQPLLVVRRALDWTALLAAAPAAGNVLQGALAPPLPWARWWQLWRVAAALLAALVLLDAGLTLAAGWRLRAEQTALQQQMLATFHRIQPQAPVVDPLLQVRQLLAQGGGQHALLPLLTRMAPVLGGTPDASVQMLDFDAAAGSLQLEVRGTTLAAIDSLRSRLQAAGLAVELIGSASEGNDSRARLRLEAP